MGVASTEGSADTLSAKPELYKRPSGHGCSGNEQSIALMSLSFLS